MATNNPWSAYMRRFPGVEEVKWTEKPMNKIYVVPKLSIKLSLQCMVRRPQMFSVCMKKGEISK